MLDDFEKILQVFFVSAGSYAKCVQNDDGVVDIIL